MFMFTFTISLTKKELLFHHRNNVEKYSVARILSHKGVIRSEITILSFLQIYESRGTMIIKIERHMKI